MWYNYIHKICKNKQDYQKNIIKINVILSGSIVAHVKEQFQC